MVYRVGRGGVLKVVAPGALTRDANGKPLSPLEALRRKERGLGRPRKNRDRPVEFARVTLESHLTMIDRSKSYRAAAFAWIGLALLPAPVSGRLPPRAGAAAGCSRGHRTLDGTRSPVDRGSGRVRRRLDPRRHCGGLGLGRARCRKRAGRNRRPDERRPGAAQGELQWVQRRSAGGRAGELRRSSPFDSAMTSSPSSQRRVAIPASATGRRRARTDSGSRCSVTTPKAITPA